MGAEQAAEHIARGFSRRDLMALVVILLTVIGSAATTGAYVGGLVASVEARMEAFEIFMASGSRCTAAECGAISARLDKLEQADITLGNKIESLPRPPPDYKELVDTQLRLIRDVMARERALESAQRVELREVVDSLREQVAALAVQVGDHRTMIRNSVH